MKDHITMGLSQPLSAICMEILWESRDLLLRKKKEVQRTELDLDR